MLLYSRLTLFISFLFFLPSLITSSNSTTISSSVADFSNPLKLSDSVFLTSISRPILFMYCRGMSKAEPIPGEETSKVYFSPNTKVWSKSSSSRLLTFAQMSKEIPPSRSMKISILFPVILALTKKQSPHSFS